MNSYDIKIEEISIGGHDFKIRSLKDRQQFSDDRDIAGDRGISSANWSHFGVVWPCGIRLMVSRDFSAQTEYLPVQMLMGQSYKGRIMTFERGAC